LETLIKFIDFRLIKVQTLVNIVEPFNIILIIIWKVNRDLEKMMDNKWSVLERIIILLTLKNLNNSRKFNNLLNQKEIFKESETLIKYINFRLIKA